MSGTITRSVAGAVAVIAACSITPSFARPGGGAHSGGGPVIQGGGGGFHGGGAGFQAAPSRSIQSGGNFTAHGATGAARAAPDAFRVAHGNVGGRYAYVNGHHRHNGHGGYYGDGGFYGWNYGYNAYCSPYWLSINPNLCYNGS